MCAERSASTSCWREVGAAVADLFRLRVCHRKAGRLRHLSHLETARACERAIRRAGLPYAITQGFKPRMRIAFGPALPVGTAGEREYYDVWLAQFVPLEHAVAGLRRTSVENLAPVTGGYVSSDERSLAAALVIAEYDVRVEGGIPQGELERFLDELTSVGALSVEHKGKKKDFDLALALPKRPEVRSEDGRSVIRVTVRMSEQGSLRPDLFVAAAIARPARLAVTRVDLLTDDGGVWSRPL